MGTADRTIVIGNLAHQEPASFRDLRYRFYSFDISDVITSMDVRVSSPPELEQAIRRHRRMFRPLVRSSRRLRAGIHLCLRGHSRLGCEH